MTKTTTRFHIQASLDGGKWFDSDAKGFRSRKQAERKFDKILRGCYPTWRGMRLCWRIVKRKLTVTTETEIAVFSTPSHGKKRSLLSELFIPTWLPQRQIAQLKTRPIPDCPHKWQPTAILNNDRFTP